MRTSLRRGLCGVVALLASAGAAAALTLDEIMEKGELSVALYRDFPPFSWRRDGELAGVDVDLAKAMAERLKLRLSVMELTAGESVDDDLRNGVWKGHYLERRVADVMLHVPVDRMFALRNKNAVIFAPYFRERVAVARDPERVLAKDGVAIFRQERVGVELATLPDMYLTAQLGPAAVANVVHFPTVGRAVAALIKGDVAAVMATESELATALGDSRDRFPIGPMAMPGLDRSSWELGLAVKEGNRHLAHVLEDVLLGLRADGTVADIFRRHGLAHLSPED